LNEETTKSARKFIFEKTQLIEIDSFPERDNESKRVFEDAKMSVCIVLFKKCILENFNFRLSIWDDNEMLVGKQIQFAKSEIFDLFNDSYNILY
jgi:hypothetical protein